MTDTAKAFARELIQSGITYTAEFVPQSQSRNADDRDDRGNLRRSLNWRVTIARKGGGAALSLTTDYMQGMGHKPGYNVPVMRKTLDDATHEGQAAEKGRYWKSARLFGPGQKIPAPAFVDVLYSLVMDCDVLNYVSFEDWAECMGYDTDSRSAEAIYNACRDHALRLRHIVDLDKAAEAFEDY